MHIFWKQRIVYFVGSTSFCFGKKKQIKVTPMEGRGGGLKVTKVHQQQEQVAARVRDVRNGGWPRAGFHSCLWINKTKHTPQTAAISKWAVDERKKRLRECVRVNFNFLAGQICVVIFLPALKRTRVFFFSSFLMGIHIQHTQQHVPTLALGSCVLYLSRAW